MSGAKSKVKRVGRVLLLIVIGLIIGTTVYSLNARALTGNAMPMPFRVGISVVLSGSMEPELSVNDLVIVRESDRYEIGDTVVYQDGASLVIHKILSIDGDTVTTKGVANNTADAPVPLSAIKGKAVAHIPLIGAAVQFLKSTVGSILLLLAAVVLFELPYLRQRKRADEEKEKLKEEIRKLKGE